MSTQKNLLQGKTLVPVKDLEMEMTLQLALKNNFTIISCDFHKGLGASVGLKIKIGIWLYPSTRNALSDAQHPQLRGSSSKFGSLKI